MMNSSDIKIVRCNRRSIMIKVTSDAELVVRAPFYVSRSKIDAFLESKKTWIEKSIARALKHKEKFLSVSKEEEILLREMANDVLTKKVASYGSIMKLYPSAIRITSAKKRLGSCSPSDSICFSWRLMLYDDDVIDYVVVHELAHIKYKNHGREFYGLIASVLPDYRNAVRKIKTA